MMKRFTLVELLVVVAVIAMLVAILMPALGKAKAMASSSVCMSNMRQCGTGLIAYADDFNGWVLCGEGNTDNSGNPIMAFANLADLLMQCNYVPFANKPEVGSYYSWLRPNNVFRCPALPAPTKPYKVFGHTLPENGLITSSETFGLRRVRFNQYYPGEQLSPVNNRLPKYVSLYLGAPYMVDTLSYFASPTGDYYVPNQSCNWYTDNTSAWAANGFSGFHLRHNKRGNAWFPDGHVASLGAAEASAIKQPGVNSFSTASLLYSY